MRKIKGFDKVLLKAGREADVVETFANKVFIVYVGDVIFDRVFNAKEGNRIPG